MKEREGRRKIGEAKDGKEMEAAWILSPAYCTKKKKKKEVRLTFLVPVGCDIIHS